MLLNCDVGEDSWESLGLQGDPTSSSWRKSVLNIHWKDWGWSWNSNTLATWCEELTHLKRPLCWERLRTGGEGDDRGWDGWMASPTQWTCLNKVWELVMSSNHLILWRPLLLLPSIFPSIRVFSNESPLHTKWPKYWSFSFHISPSNEQPGLLSFRMDWLDLLAVQGTLKSLLQHHSSKASILHWSTFFIVQLSHPYMTTGNTIALTRLTFVNKVMSLLFNILSKLIIAFLPRRSIF